MNEPRHILITGASSGIGAALAIQYAAPGVTLALTGRSETRLAEVAAATEKRGALCHWESLDVRDSEALLAWLQAIDGAMPIDLAILNAGLAATRASAAEGERIVDIIAQADTNVRATLIAAQFLGLTMAGRGRGQVALVSSLNALFPVVEAPTYSAGKAALVAYASAARDWLEPRGVAVSVICPGFVRTAIAERYDGPRPLELSAERAASHIARQLARGKSFIAFPWAMLLAIRVGRLMPRGLRRVILARFSASLRPPAG